MPLPAHFSQSPASSLPGLCHARSFLPISCFFPSRAMPLPAHIFQSPASFLPGLCHCPLISPILLLLPFRGYAIARSYLPISCFFPFRAMPLSAHISQSLSSSVPGQCHCPLISPILLISFQGYAIARSFLPISCFFPSRAMPCPLISPNLLLLSVPGLCHSPLISSSLLLLPFQGNAIPAHFSQSPASFLPGQCHCPLISPNLLLLPFQGNAMPAHFSQSPASSVSGQCRCPLISPNLLLLSFQGYGIV